MPTSDDRAEILGMLRAYHAAMVDGRTDDLDALLDAGFALVHRTGYVQPREEWLEVVRDGQFDYHRIDVDERSLAVTVTGAAAMVKGRGIFDATIHGMRRPWRLQFTLRLAKPRDRWILMHARYTSC
jgi:hypothetical protein